MALISLSQEVKSHPAGLQSLWDVRFPACGSEDLQCSPQEGASLTLAPRTSNEFSTWKYR